MRSDALIDSGSSLTLINEDYFSLIPNIKLCSPPDSVGSIEGVVVGSKLEVVGAVYVPIKIGKFISKVHPVLVVRGMRRHCLLGMDFLDRFFISIDSTYRVLRIKPPQGHEIQINVHPSFPMEQLEDLKVVSSQNRVVPPRSVAFIEVRVKSFVSDGDGYFEPNEGDNPNFLMPRSLNTVKGGLAMIECVNVTNGPIHVHKSQALGIFTPINLVNVLDIEPPVKETQHAANVADCFDLSGADLTEAEKVLVREFLERHAGVIGTSELDLGATETVRHKIDVQNAPPIKQPYRRFPAPLRAEIGR